MVERRYTVLDVFTDTPLEGNPVAVFEDALDLEPGLMLRVARETNLSETVFLGPITETPGEGEPHAAVRIFTPGTELPFAGHPILGTAFLVGERLGGQAGEVEVRLQAPAGLIPVRLTRGEDGFVAGEMEQPLPVLIDFPQRDEATQALGIERAVLDLAVYRNGPVHGFIELESVAAVSALRPDLGRLAALGELGFTAYAPAGEPNAYRSRMFAPGLGVPEDPATGSAAGPLAVHLLRHGRIAPGTQIRIDQGVEMGRPSVLLARVEGSAEALERVLVAGGAVVVAHGKYRFG